MNYIDNVKNKMNEKLTQLHKNWSSLLNRSKHALTKFTDKDEDSGSQKLLQQWYYNDGFGLVPVDLYEDDKSLYLRVEVPGMGKKDLSIQVIGTQLVINGDKKITREEKREQFHVMECVYGRFQRIIELPCLINENKSEANCKNGVLKIILPKKYEENKQKGIVINEM